MSAVVERRPRGQEQRIGALARRQHGVVARHQLLAGGIDRHLIDNLVKVGRLAALHRGVYQVGPIAQPRAREMAAVMACGRGTVLSHRSAAAAWGLLPYPAKKACIDITVVARRIGKRRGIRMHFARSLDRDETTNLNRIPITTPPRTILDIASEARARELEQAVAKAERRHVVSPTRLRALLARYPGRPGTRALRDLLDRAERPAFTRSEAEERLLHLIRRAELPPPEVNVQLDGIEVDFLWRAQGLVVEVDGFEFHSTRADHQRDHRRDSELLATGLRVQRFSAIQVFEEPEATVVRIARALTGLR